MGTPVRMLDWYRADPWPRMRRVLLAGPAVLTLGGLVVAVSFATRAPAVVRELADIVGLFLVAGGAGVTMAGMHRILRDDSYLSIRTDGVMYQSASTETFVGWDDVRHVRWDAPRGALVIERQGGEAVVVSRRFARIDGRELAERIEQVRRRALMGMALVE